MAAAAVSRSLASSFTLSFHKHLSRFSRLMNSPHPNLCPSTTITRTAVLTPSAATIHPRHTSSAPSRPFATSSDDAHKPRALRNPKLVNFSLSDSEGEEAEGNGDGGGDATTSTPDGNANLPPPYDPFSKKPVVEEPEDPKNLQEIFHKMRAEGLTDYAVKMFDALSKDGRTHEALELFGQIKDKGHMPDVVAHTAVIEAYCNAGGQSKEALKVFMRMLASGVAPNAYTYAVLVKGLAGDGRLADAKKYVMEMMSKGMMPAAATYAAVFEAFAKDQKEEEARELLEAMKGKGFVPDEMGVGEVIASKRGPVFKSVMSILFGK
ncbi:pentatricopeptide repeat-containing protein At4g38150-like [Rhodamnia argentea]|uniref:Pentatricopeptide repeat-containing protein At4g38150-like n=1 Tax=Rhodamnia argentea TaxID=178133 RepID=A0A8B8Q0S2_9MYRT|nr:pentatricopeptide repeat-containing protein At4g38150-like [Rhodamnia argentea]